MFSWSHRIYTSSWSCHVLWRAGLQKKWQRILRAQGHRSTAGCHRAPARDWNKINCYNYNNWTLFTRHVLVGLLFQAGSGSLKQSSPRLQELFLFAALALCGLPSKITTPSSVRISVPDQAQNQLCSVSSDVSSRWKCDFLIANLVTTSKALVPSSDALCS